MLSAIMSMLSCSKESENVEKMNFYLSQPRDPYLAGWWVIVDSDQD